MICPHCNAPIPVAEQGLGACSLCKTLLHQSIQPEGEVPLKKMFLVIAIVFFGMVILGSIITVYLLETVGH